MKFQPPKMFLHSKESPHVIMLAKRNHALIYEFYSSAVSSVSDLQVASLFFGAAQEKTNPTPPALFKILHRPSFEFSHSKKVIFQLLVDFIFLGLKERIQRHILHRPKPTHALEMILSFPYFQTCRTAVNIFGARCARVHLSELALERLHSSRNSDP